MSRKYNWHFYKVYRKVPAVLRGLFLWLPTCPRAAYRLPIRTDSYGLIVRIDFIDNATDNLYISNYLYKSVICTQRADYLCVK
jgi:hypothetical protein